MENVKDRLSRRNLSTAKPLFTQLTFKKYSRHLPKVRHNSGSQILDCSRQNIDYECYLTKVKSSGKLDERIIVSNCLNNLRKQYDQMAKMSHKQENNINRKRRDIQFMRKKYNDGVKDNQQWEARYKKVINGTNLMQKKEKDIKMETRTLYHIMDRMRKDQIYYKNILREKQLLFSERRRGFKQKQHQLLQCQEVIHKTIMEVQQLEAILEKNRSFREDKFEDYCQKIQHLQDKERFIQLRQQRTYQLLNMQSNDILHDKNIIAREITIANKLADFILENQINSLLKKYSPLQNAYHLIKTKTNINQPQLLITKFLSYGQLSNQLIKSISASEMHYDKLSKKNKQLSEHYKQLLNKYYEEEITKYQPRSDMIQEKMKISSQITDRSLLIQRIINWIDKKSTLLKSHHKHQNNQKTKFQNLCSKLINDINQFESKQNYKDRKFQNNGIIIKKLVKELTIEEETKRQSQMQEITQTNSIERLFLLEQNSNVKNTYSKIQKHR